MYAIELTAEPAVPGDANTVGGRPILAPGQQWPACDCGERMALFFQVDVPADVPVFGGEHLLMFQCPVHNEAWFGGDQMVHWRALRHRGGVAAEPEDPHLQPLRLRLREAGPDDEWAFRIGGEPAWIQGVERHTCDCGAEMRFLLQIPEDYGFPKRAEAPEQPDTFARDEYGLLLGNMVYLLACPAACHPAATWPINQN